MDIKEAVELLKTKLDTQDEKLALAVLVRELDMQFCYAWGAGCAATADWINKTVLRKWPLDVRGEIDRVGDWMAMSPQMDRWRGDDFPQMDEFYELTEADSLAKEQAAEAK